VRSRARKSLLLAGGIVGSLLVIVIGGMAVALTTTGGARWSIAAVRNLVPGELAVDGVAGSWAGGLTLSGVRYESPQLAVTLARLLFEPRLRALLDGRVVVDRLEAEDGTVTLRGSGAAATTAPGEPPTLPDVPEWLAVSSLRVRDVTAINAAGAETAVITELAAAVAGSRIDVAALEGRAAGGRFEASGQARLGDEAAAAIDASWATPRPSDSGAGADTTRIELTADVALATNVTPWRATLAWSRLAVEAAGTAWSSAMGRLTLTPGTMPIEAELSAELSGSVLPTPAGIVASASLAGETLELEELVLETLGGRMVARGTADVRALAGHAAVEYSMLDPSLIDARIEGSLDGRGVTAFAAEPELVVATAGELGGTLGGRTLEGSLQARYRNGSAHIDRARVVLEQSTIELAGRVSGDTVDARFEAMLPELGNWYPPAAGSLHAVGSLAGPAGDPSVDAELTARNITVDASPPLEELALDVTGTLSAHRARLAATSSYGELDLRVEQGWNGERLAGSVLESRLALNRAGAWMLTNTAEYAVAGESVRLESLCYAGPQQARLCAAVADDTLSIEASELPSALAEPWLAEGMRLDGAADIMLTLGWRPALHGSFTLMQPSLRLRQTGTASAADEPNPADFASINDVRITGILTEQALAADLTASLTATADPLAAHLTLEPPTADGSLDATFSARLTNLELVDALLEDVENLGGSATVELRATGTLAEPGLEGELAVRSLSAAVPELGIEVTEGRVTARPLGLNGIELTAELCSMGCIALDGSLALGGAAAPWHATAALTGDSFTLVDLPDLRAVVTPDFRLDATPASWQVTGDVLIQQGLVAVDAVPRSAVRPVPETVVHGRSAEREDDALLAPLAADVGVRLGDVRFEGLGIAAELDGSLEIERTIEGQLLVNGTASIADGTFSAYSQQLEIERGDLLFTGPSDNPALDVRASREVDGATVGLTVTGTLRNPQSEVFSVPALTQSEALARLVTGRSLESAGEADAEAIERAALGLGIRRALPGLERIGRNLGLDELGVDTGSGDESAIVAGRQLGKDVYLRYKHGLFDDFAGLELIYRISQRLRLRTETGTAQSVDLLYERNRDEDAPLAETESAFDDVARSGSPDASAAGEPQ
jgi:translocation and assembly module TamB